MNGNVYFLDIKNIEYDERLVKELPLYCQNKIEKVNNVCLKKSRTLSWYFLKQILLKEYDINLHENQIYENKNGKPYIDNIYFNITHSNDYIGIISYNNTYDDSTPTSRRGCFLSKCSQEVAESTSEERR